MGLARLFYRAIVSGGMIAGATAMLSPSAAQDLAGPFLAARIASANGAYAPAARFYVEALQKDQQNLGLIEGAVSSFIGLGQFPQAIAVASQAPDDLESLQAAYLMLAAQAGKREQWDTIITAMDNGRQYGGLTDDLIRAWALRGKGDVDAATTQIDSLLETEALQAFGLYHKALILASDRQYQAAADILFNDGQSELRLARRGTIALIQILSQIGAFKDAQEVLNERFGTDLDGQLRIISKSLSANEPVPFDVAPDAVAGMAEVFYTIANALRGDSPPNFVLLYARLAGYMRPDHIEAQLLSATLLEQLDQYDLAITTYSQVSDDDPSALAAELGRANAMRRAGRIDAAIEVLQALIKKHPTQRNLYVTLGDFLSQEERFEQARDAYSNAIDLIQEENPSDWGVYFVRGIANERTDRWPDAEADFRKALALEPDQPQVLNYLGYSMVEMQINLDEALEMIETAVAARPDSGHIVDSLGWVLYRLGRYEEAVFHMERAVELMPVDPVVNDHLGDVYWAVGRKLEARFQWSRALSFVDPDDTFLEADPDRIRRKLKIGLDGVLQEEGAPPLNLVNDTP